jgi:hypothetical protein
VAVKSRGSGLFGYVAGARKYGVAKNEAPRVPAGTGDAAPEASNRS